LVEDWFGCCGDEWNAFVGKECDIADGGHDIPDVWLIEEAEGFPPVFAGDVEVGGLPEGPGDKGIGDGEGEGCRIRPEGVMGLEDGEGDFGGVETGLGNGGEAGGEELVADAKWAMDEEMFAGKVFAAPGACVDVGVCDNAEETWRGGCEVRGDGVGGDVPFIFCQSHCADVYIGDGV
jgi:hypothetical protein